MFDNKISISLVIGKFNQIMFLFGDNGHIAIYYVIDFYIINNKISNYFVQ